MQEIRIQVDDREAKGPVLRVLQRRADFEVTVAHLPLGDYLVDGRFLFERKTLPDLVESIKSGRLFSQALKLAQVKNMRPAVVLEGTSKDLHGCGMRWEALQGALVTVALFVGLPVLRTRSPEDTVQTFLYAALQGRAVASGALPRRGHRPKGKAALQRHILQGLPGVGPRRAAQLLARFSSVQAALLADERELASVPGIGKRVARGIVWAAKETRARYRPDRATSSAHPAAITVPPPSHWM